MRTVRFLSMVIPWAAAAAMEPELFDKLILTSPMIRSLTGSVSWILARMIADPGYVYQTWYGATVDTLSRRKPSVYGKKV